MYPNCLSATVLSVPLSLCLVAAAVAAPARPARPAASAALEATIAPAAPVSTPPPGPRQVTSVEGITEYRLANGLKLLVFPDPAASTITVNMTYLVGSRQEGAGEGGMAHLLEHMLFKGSPRHTNIPQELTEHGARPNGTTSWDRTNYFETFQATDENLRWALDLEADRMVHSFVRGTDLASEFTVVRSEFESGENNPFGVLFRQTMSTAYRAHSYGRPVIGNRSDVERVPVERLQVFYRTYYQPDNAVLTVAGKVDEAQIVAMVQGLFGAIPKPMRVLPTTYTVEPVQDGERMTVVRRVGDIQAVVAMYHVPEGASADDAPLDVLATLLGDAPSGRLYRALTESKKATQVAARTLSLNEPGVFYAVALMNPAASIDDARALLLSTVETVAATPPTVAEVDRARTRLLAQVDQALRDSTRVGLTLSEAVGQGDWRLLFKSRDQLRAVTPADVQRVAAAYLKPSNRTVGEFIPTANPDRVEIPPKADVEAMLQGYRGDPAMAAGEAFDPSPANIESRTTRYTTPAGAKVSLMAKKTRGAAVKATIQLHFGTLDALQGQLMTGHMAGVMLLHGSARHTRQQLQDELDRLGARLNVDGGVDGAVVSIDTTRDKLVDVMRLAAEVLRSPTFPTGEFERGRDLWLTETEAERSNPAALASQRLDRALYEFPRDDPRHRTTIDEQLADIRAAKVDALREFHRRFYGASNAEIAVVGDFDPAPVQAAVNELFGRWASPQPYAPILQGFERRPPVNDRIETPDKANANFYAAERLNLRTDDADYAPLVLGNYLLGGGFLNSRLATRIRVKDGLSYGVGSSVSASADERNGRFQVSAIAAPQNVAKVEAAMREELTKAMADGFTAKEVETGQAGWLQSQQVGRASDASLARLLAARDHEGRTLAWDAEFEARVKAATSQSIAEAMRRQIDPAQLSFVKGRRLLESRGPLIASQFVSRVTLRREQVDSFDGYPFALSALRTLTSIDFHPKVTFFVGENGSGKSTLLEAIAVSLGLNAEGGSRNFRFASRESHSNLHEFLRVAKGFRPPRDMWFLRAESFFNVATEIEALDAEPGGPPIIDSYGGRSLHEQSHGESFLALLTKRLTGLGLYLLDEPEAALSPQRQLTVLARIHELVRQKSQFIIATHSPLLMAYPDASILHFGPDGIAPIDYEDTEHFRVTRGFLNDRASILASLFDRA